MDRPVSRTAPLTRRTLLVGGAVLSVGSARADASAVIEQFPLGSPPWQTFDPFLFCVHHRDNFPRGTEQLGPAQSLLQGRSIGRDFAGIGGWNMYHGETVPGFPRHPHRGFETVTITRRGFVDHSDSLGATARYGQGDVQWMTAGSGIVHAEMFPLLADRDKNPAELFQLWLNLPEDSKFATPYFSMFWGPQVPQYRFLNAEGAMCEVTTVTGRLNGAGQQMLAMPQPPPQSWARNPAHSVAIWSLRLAPHASWTLPPAPPGCHRTLYYFQGDRLRVGANWVHSGTGLRLAPTVATSLENAEAPSEVLMLQGRPIGQPVVKHGPFVMNDSAGIRQAVADYRRTRFGGWPWPSSDPVHAKRAGRFAIHADGRKELGV